MTIAAGLVLGAAVTVGFVDGRDVLVILVCTHSPASRSSSRETGASHSS